jgi:hypothetical protein
MHISLNEVTLSVLKAGRGAGLGEGLAEDLAEASNWLCQASIDGMALALQALKHLPDDANTPTDGAAGWTYAQTSAARDVAGALDLLIAHGPFVQLNEIDVPPLVVGFAGHAATHTHKAYELKWDNGAVTIVSATQLSWFGGNTPGRAVTVRCADAVSSTTRQSHDGADVDGRVYDGIQEFASRTYVPATEHSRAHGAGAGIVDSD